MADDGALTYFEQEDWVEAQGGLMVYFSNNEWAQWLKVDQFINNFFISVFQSFQGSQGRAYLFNSV